MRAEISRNSIPSTGPLTSHWVNFEVKVKGEPLLTTFVQRSIIVVEFMNGVSKHQGYERGEFVRKMSETSTQANDGDSVGFKTQIVYDKNMFY